MDAQRLRITVNFIYKSSFSIMFFFTLYDEQKGCEKSIKKVWFDVCVCGNASAVFSPERIFFRSLFKSSLRVFRKEAFFWLFKVFLLPLLERCVDIQKHLVTQTGTQLN